LCGADTSACLLTSRPLELCSRCLKPSSMRTERSSLATVPVYRWMRFINAPRLKAELTLGIGFCQHEPPHVTCWCTTSSDVRACSDGYTQTCSCFYFIACRGVWNSVSQCGPCERLRASSLSTCTASQSCESAWQLRTNHERPLAQTTHYLKRARTWRTHL
jgi:hypothetical protein